MTRTSKFTAIGLVLSAIAIAGHRTPAAERSSSNFRVTLEAVTNAGGSAASGGLFITDSAVGQSVETGVVTSTSYAARVGFIQDWRQDSAAELWSLYE